MAQWFVLPTHKTRKLEVLAGAQHGILHRAGTERRDAGDVVRRGPHPDCQPHSDSRDHYGRLPPCDVADPMSLKVARVEAPALVAGSDVGTAQCLSHHPASQLRQLTQRREMMNPKGLTPPVQNTGPRLIETPGGRSVSMTNVVM